MLGIAATSRKLSAGMTGGRSGAFSKLASSSRDRLRDGGSSEKLTKSSPTTARSPTAARSKVYATPAADGGDEAKLADPEPGQALSPAAAAASATLGPTRRFDTVTSSGGSNNAETARPKPSRRVSPFPRRTPWPHVVVQGARRAARRQATRAGRVRQRAQMVRRAAARAAFEAQLDLYSEMCLDRSYNSIYMLEREFSYELFVSAVANALLPDQIRASFTVLLKNLYINRYPHEVLQAPDRLQVLSAPSASTSTRRTRCRISHQPGQRGHVQGYGRFVGWRRAEPRGLDHGEDRATGARIWVNEKTGGARRATDAAPQGQELVPDLATGQPKYRNVAHGKVLTNRPPGERATTSSTPSRSSSRATSPGSRAARSRASRTRTSSRSRCSTCSSA